MFLMFDYLTTSEKLFMKETKLFTSFINNKSEILSYFKTEILQNS